MEIERSMTSTDTSNKHILEERGFRVAGDEEELYASVSNVSFASLCRTGCIRDFGMCQVVTVVTGR